MTDKRVVVVTGVGGYWGARVATQLSASHPDWQVLGLDENAPSDELAGVEFIQTSLHNPALVDFFKEEQVDTVCHVAFDESARATEATFDTNVMGTMKLLGTCAEAGVRKVVLKSSMMVYGAHPQNSAFLREDSPLQGNKAYGYIRDWVEIEAFGNGFRRQSPETIVTILRFAHIVGQKADTPMTRFLREEEAMVLLGFDPIMQIIHEEDVIGAIGHAAQHDVPGVFNVAAPGAMPLWRIMGLAGKLTAPILHVVAFAAVSFLGPRYAPIELNYLRYRCVGDLQKMRDELQFTPHYTAEEALREFASQYKSRRYMGEENARHQEETLLRDTMERRRRIREEQAAAAAPVKAKRRAAKTPRARRTRESVLNPTLAVVEESSND